MERYLYLDNMFIRDRNMNASALRKSVQFTVVEVSDSRWSPSLKRGLLFDLKRAPHIDATRSKSVKLKLSGGVR